MFEKLICVRRSAVILFLVLSMIFGCSTGGGKLKRYDTSPEKIITDISVTEDEGVVRVLIEGRGDLTYSSVKQTFPLGVILYFPETKLLNVKPSIKIDGSLVSGIDSSQFTKKGVTSRIKISLKKDMSYNVTKTPAGLSVSFVRGESAVKSDSEDSGSPTKKPADFNKATVLNSITAKVTGGNVNVSLNANGGIEDYKIFTIEKPARIIFDIFNLKSSYSGEQSISIKSRWVKKVRYNSYPDRLRVIIDTYSKYLSSYAAKTVAGGLSINIGNDPESFNDTEGEEQVKTSYLNPALVNRIDFSGDEEGRSSIIVGTTREVEYDVVRINEKKLHLTLSETTISKYRQRPLITTRFESAVNRIIPVHKSDREGNSLIIIELRENVPFFVDQTDNLLKVNFEASVVPPMKAADAKLPPWKYVLNKSIEEMEEGVLLEEFKGDGYEGGKQRKIYTGEKIALDFYDTDIKNVLRVIRTVSGKNFAIDKDVSGKVTLSLETPVPWDQVLDLVLKMNMLGMVYENNIIRVATLETLRIEEEKKKALILAAEESRQQRKAVAPISTEYIPINYSSAAEVMPHIQKILSKGRGQISIDERTNQVIVSDTDKVIDQAKEIVKQLDKVTAQVSIEARIVEASSNFSREIGTQWNAKSTEEGTYNRNLGGIYGFDISMSNPVASASGVGLSFSKLLGTRFLLDAKLLAMESKGEGKIISSPKVVTIDNKKATIKQGVSYPYQEIKDDEVSTVFKDIDLLLEVVPHVTLDKRISMQIKVTKNDLGSIINDKQSFTTKEAETELLVNDGDTIVIGGITKSRKNYAQSRFPFLSKIPIIGWFFKSVKQSHDKEELLIFITPNIVQLDLVQN